MIPEHATAMLALLTGAPGSPALVVYDGVTPAGATAPYVLVYFASADPELADSRSLRADSRRHVTRAYAHCVGGNQAAARSVAKRVRTAWLDVRPTVAGRQCQPIRREEGQPAQRDESLGTPVLDLVEVYRLESEPA